MKGFAILIKVEDEYFDEVKEKIDNGTLCDHIEIESYYTGEDEDDYDSLKHSFNNEI